MKKVFTIISAVVLTFAMSTTAFAAVSNQEGIRSETKREFTNDLRAGFREKIKGSGFERKYSRENITGECLKTFDLPESLKDSREDNRVLAKENADLMRLLKTEYRTIRDNGETLDNSVINDLESYKDEIMEIRKEIKAKRYENRENAKAFLNDKEITDTERANMIKEIENNQLYKKEALMKLQDTLNKMLDLLS